MLCLGSDFPNISLGELFRQTGSHRQGTVMTQPENDTAR